MRKSAVIIVSLCVLAFTACGSSSEKEDNKNTPVATVTSEAAENTTEALEEGVTEKAELTEAPVDEPTESVEEPTVTDEPTETAEPTKEPTAADLQFYTDFGKENEKLWLDGTHISNAKYFEYTNNAFTGKSTPVCQVQFDEEGTAIIKEVTGQLAEDKGKIDMVYMGKLLWSADVYMEISDGLVNVVCTSQEEAESMAEVCNGNK